MNRKSKLVLLIVLTALGTVMPAEHIYASANAPRVAWLWDEAAVPEWSTAHVAIVVRHILLREHSVLQRPRTSSPHLAPETLVTPVVHVEISSQRPPIDIAQGHTLIVKAMQQAARMSTSGWVQLDMEARPSQRSYFKQLVREIRSELPAQMKLSITALAWWCRSDQWFDDLAADEVVPMFFRMGKDSASMREMVQSGAVRLHPACRRNVAGFSRQEAFPRDVVGRYSKTYWFDNQRWQSQ